MPAFAFATPGTTVSIESYLTNKGQNYLQRYTNASNRLADDFNLICGSVFCQGQYGRILPLPMRCFVDSGTGDLRTCIWAFGKSTVWIGRESAIEKSGEVEFCEFKPTMTAEVFIATIENARVSGQTPYLSIVFPGVGTTLTNVLANCLR